MMMVMTSTDVRVIVSALLTDLFALGSLARWMVMMAVKWVSEESYHASVGWGSPIGLGDRVPRVGFLIFLVVFSF